MPSQAEKGKAFRALHQRDEAFIIPNPWDVGTVRLLQSLGFKALATTSAGFAFSIGKPDGAVDRETMLAHAAFVHRLNFQLLADLADVLVLALEGERRGARSHAQCLDLGQGIDDLLSHAVGEVFVFRVVAHVGKGQHRHRLGGRYPRLHGHRSAWRMHAARCQRLPELPGRRESPRYLDGHRLGNGALDGFGYGGAKRAHKRVRYDYLPHDPG